MIRSPRSLFALTFVVWWLAACSDDFGGGLPPGVPTVVTSVSGTLIGYEDGATSAALAEWPARHGHPWIPFAVEAPVSAVGTFHAELPSSPLPSDSDSQLFGLCGSSHAIPTLSFLFTYIGSLDAPTVTGMYANFQLEESEVGFSFTQVIYAHSRVEVNLLCREVEPGQYGTSVVDVDLRLRPGWNVVSMFADSEDEIFIRSGETQRTVQWQMYSDILWNAVEY